MNGIDFPDAALPAVLHPALKIPTLQCLPCGADGVVMVSLILEPFF